jgi:metal-dependent hydrolase (beta-lactamase superfamily II)
MNLSERDPVEILSLQNNYIEMTAMDDSDIVRRARDPVIPCHCTGRKAIMQIEQAMPGQFILNMSGTTLTFRA